MNPRNHLCALLAALLATAALTAQAQTPYYKTNNNDSLELASSWTNGVVTGTPPGQLDTAIWDAQVATAANCSNTLAANLNWGGIQVLNPAAPVKVTSSSTLGLDALGIDLNEPGTTQDLWLAVSVTTTADQNWAMQPGRTLTLGDASRNVNLQNNVAVNGHLVYMYNLRVQSGGTLWLTNSATTLELGASTLTTTPLLVGNNATGVNTVYQTAGTVKLKRTDGTTGSPKTTLDIANAASSTGIYTITGGSIQEVSTLNTATLNVGDGSSANGTFNVDGTASVTVGSIRLANAAGATGTMNLTNGTVTVTGGTFDVGRTTSAVPGPGTLNVYGGTLYSAGGMDLPHGNGPGFFNLYGGNVFLNGMNLTASGAAIGNGVLTVNGGSLFVTNSINLPNGANGTGTLNLNGGTLTVNSLAHPGTAAGTVVFNGGILKARANQVNFIASAVTANIAAGGAVIDNAGFNLTIPAPLVNGASGTDGGFIKQGLGTLTLAGANTYNGPTRVNAGTLYLTTTNHGGGPITVNNNATLHATVASAGTTLNCASLALGSVGASSGGMLTNEFDLNGFANPAVPVINTPSLAAAGTVYVNVAGSGWSPGAYHLIQYSGSVAGSDYAFVLNLVSGAVGYVTNNSSTHYIDLVITSLPSLVWRAQVNTNWDTTTLNWADLASGLPATYPNGAATLFDDSASNTLVYATAAFAPAAFSLANNSKDYTFTGVGRISGQTGLTKQGAGAVLMALTNNDYSGPTVISNGTFRIGANNAIPDGTGKGDVTLEGKLDLNGFNEAINGLNGFNGVVDNSGANATVLTVGNGGGNGVFAGRITNSAGSLALNKSGGSLVLLAKNSYTGGTTNGSGLLQLAYEQSIGTGPLTLNGGSLYWTDTSPHTITNKLTLGGSPTFGADTNGPLTVPGIVNFAGGGRTLTCNTDVLLANGMTNGGLNTKAGPGTLTIRNNGGDWAGGSFGLQGGTLVLDNAAAIQDGNNVRIQCTTANGVARLIITNGASLTTSNSPTSNFRVGDLAAAGATNILDLAGLVNVLPYTSPSTGDKFQMGGPGSQDIVNLLPGGVLRTRQVAKSGGSVSAAIFNFNGGTLSPNTNDFAATFMAGLDSCYILDGGAIIDTAGWDITISQQLLAGGNGGLTKQGVGTLTLVPDPFSFGLANTYTGDTVVNGGTLVLGAGGFAPSMNWVLGNGAALDANAIGLLYLTNGMALKGNGTVLGFVNVDPGAKIVPGPTPATLAFDNAPALNGALLMKIARTGTPSSDRLAVTNGAAITYGGTLTVAIAGGAPASGDTFRLFDAAAYTGAFAATNLPPLVSGLSWDTTGLYVDGTLKVTGTAIQPKFEPVVVQGASLVLSGSGGPVGGTYYVLTSTNIALPLASWTRLATNQFDATGAFRFTNALNSASKQFFDLVLP